MSVATECEVCTSPVGPRRLRDGTALDACTACGHVMRDLVATPAAHRSAAYGGDPGLDQVRLTLTMRTLDRAAGPRPDGVFEIGYGAGQVLRHYLDRGVAVSGCDPDQLGSDVDPEVARAGDLRHGHVEDVDGLPEVGLVVGVHVIEHVVDVEKSLAACHRLLAPGGRLVLLTPAADSWSLSAFSQAWWLLEDPTHVRFFTRRSMRRALEDAGFVDVRLRRLATDNLTMEGASAVRLVRPRERERGVLAEPWSLRLSTLLAPVALLLRLVVPRWRPTLLVTARKAA